MLIVKTQDGREVKAGDKVTNFRGETGTFHAATRESSPGKDGKVLVDGFESYASVWNLTVEHRD